MDFNADWSQILVTVPTDNSLKLWQVDDLDGLLARGCNWLKFHLSNSNSELARYCQSISVSQE